MLFWMDLSTSHLKPKISDLLHTECNRLTWPCLLSLIRTELYYILFMVSGSLKISLLQRTSLLDIHEFKNLRSPTAPYKHPASSAYSIDQMGTGIEWQRADYHHCYVPWQDIESTAEVRPVWSSLPCPSPTHETCPTPCHIADSQVGWQRPI